jgi:hypothetical protein
MIRFQGEELRAEKKLFVIVPLEPKDHHREKER